MNNKNDLIKIAKMYYEKGLTQQEIANEMDISRISISRLLKKAIEEGIVEIKINYTNAYYDLEKKLEDKYKGISFNIVPFEDNYDDLLKSLSNYLSNMLPDIVSTYKNIGVGWGRCLSLIDIDKKNIIKNHIYNNTFVSLLGGYGSLSFNYNSNHITSKLSYLFQSNGILLHSPSIVEDKSIKEMMLKDRSIKNTFEYHKKLDCAIISIGNPNYNGSTMYESEYFNEKELKEIKDNNICCDLLTSIYLDKNGNEVDLSLKDRTMAISEEDFKNIPYIIAVAGGKNKLDSIYFSILKGYVNELITDEVTAKYLLSK